MSVELTQPLKWHGGKHYLAKRIIGLFPPHVHYVEPFFGGGSVLLQKDPEGVSEVVNDVHGQLVNFWKVLRDESLFPQFMRLCEATPFSQDVWSGCETFLRQMDTYCPEWNGDLDRDRVYAAWWFFVLCRQSRAGKMDSFATLSRNRVRRGMNEQVSSWLTAIEGLPAVAKRLQRVVILNDDACKVIKQQDGEKTLFYLDPPYLHETRATTADYDHEMTVEQHEQLLATICGVKGKVVLSGYPSGLYDSTLADWRTVDIEIDNKAASGPVKRKMIERLWLNY